MQYQYQEIRESDSWNYRKQGREVIAKTKKVLCIMPPDILKQKKYNAYLQLYPETIYEIPAAVQDNTKVVKQETHKISYPAKSSVKKTAETVGDINDVFGTPYSIANELGILKENKIVNWAVTGICIYNDISDGDYISATGNVIRGAGGEV